MKMVKAVIKPFKLDDVKDALARLGIEGMTVYEAKGFGRQRGYTEMYRGGEYTVSLLPKIVVEVCVPDGRVDEVVRAIMEAARTSKMGDGKIFVSPVDEVYRIRTGETDNSAI